MAAYASLVSLMHTINNLNIHPRPPISLHQEQYHSLTQNLTFLQNYLEEYSNDEGDLVLERRITNAAYAAEDVIESLIVDRIHDQSTSLVDLYEDLERVIQEMDLMRKEMMEIKKERMGAQPGDLPHTISPDSTRQSTPMAVFDDVLIDEVLDKLTGEQRDLHLQIFAIVGMGGIGKTTLATYIYSNPLTVQHFDILAWVTISQEVNVREILLQLLSQVTKLGKNDLSQESEHKIGEMLYKHLWGRRYLIVMDDIWSTEAPDQVKHFFPNTNNGSRIMITTRLSSLAYVLSNSHVQMTFLGENESWALLCKIVFDNVDCLIEFEDIGKSIARNCRGLPLSIVVIGGLLKKSNVTREYWERTLENLTSIINLENDAHCLQILGTSYKALPIHLKPCFLYMGLFPEDHEIRVSDLIKLWVAEGILKPIDNISLEEVAQEYFNELIDRNLIMVHKRRWNGKAKLCKIHDLLRDLCLREAENQKFIRVLWRLDGNTIRGINYMDRRVAFLYGPKEESLQVLRASESQPASLSPSPPSPFRLSSFHVPSSPFIIYNKEDEYSPQILHDLESPSASLLIRSLLLWGFHESSVSDSFRLLRVYKYSHGPVTDSSILFQLANLRYISTFAEKYTHPFSWFLLWNLQTLEFAVYLNWESVMAPSEIWEMPLLRHLMLGGLQLPNPPLERQDFTLENLQTLSKIINFNYSEDVVKRIPNIKTLKLDYTKATLDEDDEEGPPNLHLQNLGCLEKLESFNLDMGSTGMNLMQNIAFPHSLRKLSLRGTMFSWEELTTGIGSLPLLQFLRLDSASCIGPEWQTLDGLFCSLRFLQIYGCHDLKYWETDNTHFPLLEGLILGNLPLLEEIPSSIGDIPTLKSIRLEGCSESAVDSAKRIEEEQVALGNDDLQVLVSGGGE